MLGDLLERVLVDAAPEVALATTATATAAAEPPARARGPRNGAQFGFTPPPLAVPKPIV